MGGVPFNAKTSSSRRKVANSASSIGAKLIGLLGPLAETVRSKAWSTALTMRPGTVANSLIGDSGPGGLGVVRLSAVEGAGGPAAPAAVSTPLMTLVRDRTIEVGDANLLCSTDGTLAGGLLAAEEEPARAIPATVEWVVRGRNGPDAPADPVRAESCCDAGEFSGALPGVESILGRVPPADPGDSCPSCPRLAADAAGPLPAPECDDESPAESG